MKAQVICVCRTARSRLGRETARAVALTALVAAPSAALAQTVRGTARVAIAGGESAAANDASVVLVDSAGRIVAGATTDANGRYVLRAPAAAPYRVLARRVGFTPDSSQLVLHAGESVDFNPVLRTFAVQLSAVRVDAAERCRIAPEASALAQQLWEDAQSALTATVVESDTGTAFLLRRFQRELDPDGETVRSARTWDAVSTSSEPYTSIAAESLAVHGFVVPDGGSLVYYAPDARTLISDAFARGHCFRPIERADHPGEIGLAFAPTARGDRARRDVSGALWVERATGRLVDLELTYAVPPGLRSAPIPAATARVDYGRTPSGRWIVQHWVLRMPVVTIRNVMAPQSGTTLEVGAILTREQTPTLSAVWEAGGDVVRTMPAADTALDAVGIVSGRFVDTTQATDAARNAPLQVQGVPGIHVTLDARDGTIADARYAAVSDSSGQFVINGVRPGRYEVRAGADLLDTLHVHVSPREITVTAATSQTLVTTLPSREAVVRSLCPDGIRSTEALLHGTVSEADGQPIPHAHVTLSWFDIHDDPGVHFDARSQTRSTVTDESGGYVICGIPRWRRMTVQASSGVRKSGLEDLVASDAPIRLMTITMPDRRATH